MPMIMNKDYNFHIVPFFVYMLIESCFCIAVKCRKESGTHKEQNRRSTPSVQRMQVYVVTACLFGLYMQLTSRGSPFENVFRKPDSKTFHAKVIDFSRITRTT